MGMTLSFTRVTPEELERVFAEPELAEEIVDDESRPYCFLAKAWAGIGYLLRAAGVDVDLYEDGDPIDDESTWYGWDRDKVVRTAQAFAAAPVELLVSHYDPAKLSAEGVYPMNHLWDAEDLDDLRDNYVDLVRFFQETAAVGGAAIRDFSY